MRVPKTDNTVFETPDGYDKYVRKLERELTEQKTLFEEAIHTKEKVESLKNKMKDTQLLRASSTERIEVDGAIIKEPTDAATKAEAKDIEHLSKETDKLAQVRRTALNAMPPETKGISAPGA